jgi:hypothetical protein
VPAFRPAAPRQRRANGRRAAAHVRRFIRANGLEYLWTGTYKDAPVDRAHVVADVRRFLERLQRAYGRMPVVVVIERGGKNGRLHVHFAVERWLPHEKVASLWGHGFVWVGDPGKIGARTGARKLAGYLSKYVTKDLEAEGQGDAPPERGAGHRYSVTEGWAPEERKFVTWDVPRALEHLASWYGVADRLVEWQDNALAGVYGVWLSYPDGCIASWHPPPDG